MNQAYDVFVTGGTGYIGGQLIPALLARGHHVRALARAGSVGRVPAGASPVVGDALDSESIGPGHLWPLILTPVYAVAELVPSLRADARRLGLVTLRQMVDALMRAVENPPATGTVRVVDVPAIRAS